MPNTAFQPLCTVLITLCLAIALSGCSNSPVDEDAVTNPRGFTDVDGVTIAVGRAAAQFTLNDANGKPVSLADFRGRHNVMLVFYRGQWCPFCIGHFEDIQSLFPQLPEFNTRLLAISPDDTEDLQKMAGRFDVPYTFLSDKDLSVAASYGIRKDESLPHPAVILIDKGGDVVWFYVGENYRQRPSAAQIEQVMRRVFQ